MKNLISAFFTVLAFSIRNGIASRNLVAEHITISMYWCPDLVFGRGPTQSNIYFGDEGFKTLRLYSSI